MLQFDALQWGPPARPLAPPLSLALPAGSLTAVVGRNGCGKSSLLRVIAGLQRPLAGRVSVGAAGLGAVGFLQQQQALDRQFPLSLGELAMAGLWRSRLNRVERRRRCEASLAVWQLEALADQPLLALSGGELQRALLARLELMDAPLLLLDEPDAALDAEGQAILWQRIARWQREGRTQLVVCHDLEAVRERLPRCLLIRADGCRHGASRVLTVAGTSLALLALIYRPLLWDSFDPVFLRGVSRFGAPAYALFLALVVLNLVTGFHAIGALMVVGLMMLPAAAARFWSRRLPVLLLTAAGIGASCVWLGLLLSFHANLPSGPCIVLLAGLAYLISVFVGPVHGLLRRAPLPVPC